MVLHDATAWTWLLRFAVRVSFEALPWLAAAFTIPLVRARRGHPAAGNAKLCGSAFRVVCDGQAEWVAAL